MSNDWVDVCIRGSFDTGELLSRLDDPAVQGAWEDGSEVHLYWPEDQWNEARLASIRSVLSKLVPLNEEVSLSVTRVPAQDWNEAWARSVKPLRIGRLVIRPSWESATLDPQDIEIILDPKQAFGTGHHATTRMMLGWLQEDIHGGEKVLDVGTGSAILSMAAVKLGAASAIGVEIDTVAVDCAREYVAQNGLSGRIDIIAGTLDDVAQERGATPDFVLANLDRPTILDLAEKLVIHVFSGARLVLSGVLIEQEGEVVDRFSCLGLACSGRCEEEGWVALKFLRPESCDEEA